MPLEIRPTGVPGLDTLLGGGLPRGTLLILAGPPGTGKTILSQQLCFAWVKGEAEAHDAPPRRAIYFSTLSEPHSKLIAHSESFPFFDPDELGRGVEIFSLQEFMARGLDETASAIVRQSRQIGASLVVVDGFRALEAISERPYDAREFLYKLSAQLGMLGATAVVTLERSAHDATAYGEFTTADAVIGLHNMLVNVQHRRRIEVVKMRGVRHLAGLHTYRIAADGWEVFPRIESLIQFEDPGQTNPGDEGRHGFGIGELDVMSGGGLPVGSATLLAGGPGAGKTLLSLSFLHHGLQAGESGLFAGFQEDRERLLNKARAFNMPLDDFLAAGSLTLHTLPAVELEVDEFSSLLRSEVEQRGVRRMVIDPILGIESATAREGRAQDYAWALHAYLRQRGVTTLFTKQLNTMDDAELQDSPLAVVCENLIVVRYVTSEGVSRRALTIVKMRDSWHDRGVRELAIDREHGLRILGAEQPARTLASGAARTRAADRIEGGGYAQAIVSIGGRGRRGTREQAASGEADG